MIPRLSDKEYAILDLLTQHGPDLYGLEMVKLSDGKLKRGTIYVTLARMSDAKGFVSSKTVFEESINRDRRVYSITGHGARVFAAVHQSAMILAEAPL